MGYLFSCMGKERQKDGKDEREIYLLHAAFLLPGKLVENTKVVKY